MQDDIPVLDFRSGAAQDLVAATELACRDFGLFQVLGHGLDPQLIAALRDQMRVFFALPQAVKHGVLRTAANPWGFWDRELTQHTLDWKQVYDYGPPDGGEVVPQWPTLPGFRTAVEAYYAACERVAARVLSVISVSLGLPCDGLQAHFDPEHTSFLRLNYYPRCPIPARPRGAGCAADGYLGVNHHTDAGALTLLLQDDVPGLETFYRGRWKLVEPRADALVVNLGDMVQVWSNDRYRAPLHRVVVHPERERFSVPFFFNPAYATCVEPLPTVTGPENPSRYRPIPWGAFRSARAAGDYADREYIKIGHYQR